MAITQYDIHYLENRCEREAIKEEVAYLRYLGKDDTSIKKYLWRAYRESEITEEDVEEFMLSLDSSGSSMCHGL